MPMGIGLGIGVTRGGGVGWWQSGSALDLYFAESLGFNSIDRTKTTPDSILTYTSPSPKLVYGSDGVLRYAPHNLLTYSEQLDNAAWVKVSGITVTANQIPGPTGETTADLVVKNTTALQAVRQSVTLAANSIVTQRVWAKSGNTDYIAFTDGASCVLTVSLIDGSVTRNTGALGNVSVTLEGGFYRISYTQVLTAGAQNILYMWPTDVANSGGFVTISTTASMYIWGAQLNAGSSALTYVPTTTAAVYSLPIDHNPTTFEPLGVLIEEQRTNLLTYSEQFDNGAWLKSACTITANAVAAPDGTTTADKMVESATNAYHNINRSLASTSPQQTLAFSVFAKAGERSDIFIRIQETSVANFVDGYFDLVDQSTSVTNGGTGTGATATIQDVGDGWYRCTLVGRPSASTGTGTSPAIALTDTGGNTTYSGDGASGLYLWGAQLE